VNITLYADSFSHTLSKLNVEASDAQSSQQLVVSVKPNGDQSGKVKIPAESVSSKELLVNLLGGNIQ
jgi:selenophosphate synthase